MRWNRSHAYLIGILYNSLLHKLKRGFVLWTWFEVQPVWWKVFRFGSLHSTAIDLSLYFNKLSRKCFVSASEMQPVWVVWSAIRTDAAQQVLFLQLLVHEHDFCSKWVGPIEICQLVSNLLELSLHTASPLTLFLQFPFLARQRIFDSRCHQASAHF